MPPQNVIFMGTPDFAVPALEALIKDGHHIARVYTQPPRPAGRGQRERRSAVHSAALDHGLEVRTTLRCDTTPADFSVCDVAVVAAYGLLLPPGLLVAPKRGCLNIHASLLPRWRGAAPIQRAILAGDRETGVTIMQMDEGLDTGDILLTEKIAIDETTTATRLHDELSASGRPDGCPGHFPVNLSNPDHNQRKGSPWRRD